MILYKFVFKYISKYMLEDLIIIEKIEFLVM